MPYQVDDTVQSMWNYAKDVDRDQYGYEGKNSRRFVSYEHIPLPVRDHVWRTRPTAETRRQLELNYATQVASATNVASMTVDTLKGIRGDEH